MHLSFFQGFPLPYFLLQSVFLLFSAIECLVLQHTPSPLHTVGTGPGVDDEFGPCVHQTSLAVPYTVRNGFLLNTAFWIVGGTVDPPMKVVVDDKLCLID